MRDLLRWIEEEKLKGLLCLHTFPGTEPVVDIDAWAQHLYDVLMSTNVVDITNEDL